MDNDQHWELDPMIALSFLVLGETLSHAKSTVIDQAEHELPGWLSQHPCGWGYSKAVLQEMKHDNWCPRSVHLLLGVLQQSSIGLLYAMRVSHPKALDLDHHFCTFQNCIARENASYPKAHHSIGCSCRYLGPNVLELTRQIRDGNLVLLQYVAQTSEIKVVQYQENMRFVIFSHVWADGFGKSGGNTLPVSIAELHRCL